MTKLPKEILDFLKTKRINISDWNHQILSFTHEEVDFDIEQDIYLIHHWGSKRGSTLLIIRSEYHDVYNDPKEWFLQKIPNFITNY